MDFNSFYISGYRNDCSCKFNKLLSVYYVCDIIRINIIYKKYQIFFYPNVTTLRNYVS